jgi:hypothetical protein
MRQRRSTTQTPRARTATLGTSQSAGDELVLTPGGWRPKSTVHQIEVGHHLSVKDGRFQKIHTASGQVIADYGEISTGPADKAPGGRGRSKKKLTPPGEEPFPDDGWIVFAGWENTGSNPISYFSTEWVVPPAPATVAPPTTVSGETLNQLIFLFNGLEYADGSYILQPVLQWGISNNGTTWWGGNYWAIANWYVPAPNSGNPTFVGGALIPVNPGDSLQGVMTVTGQTGSTSNYSSVFVGYPTADLNVTDIAPIPVAVETLECYRISQGSDYPDTIMTAMSNIEVKIGSTEASFSWSGQNNVTDNGQQCVVVSSASPGGDVYLFYETDPQNYYFVVDKSTFGTDEVSDVIASPAAGRFSNAFWLVLEGFTPNWIAGATPAFASASSFNASHITGLSIAPNVATPIDYELGGPGSAYGDVIQRIRFAYDIIFSSTTSFPAIGSEQTYSLFANISIAGTVLSLEPETLFELIGGADPYFTNVDSGNPNAVFYLSQDLRVFTLNVGQSPVPGAPALTNDPYGSIQSILYYFNNTPQYSQSYPPAGPDPLNSLPNQTGYETGDTSVTPLNGMGQQNYNFAIARVRLAGAPGTTSPNVRVFFRLWTAVSFDTDFNPNTTYPSQAGMSGPDLGLPVFPQASGLGLVDPQGNTLQTVPFFATGSSGTNDYNPNYVPPPNEDTNVQTITVPAGQNSVFAYFGCYLDVYNSMNQTTYPGSHHCIVAQIAYDQAPIPTMTPTGAAPSPENWDQLAQRNLQITPSGQPGFPITHRIPQTFDTRPSLLPIFQTDGELLNYPDELMIDWGNTPVGSVARIYWPQVSSAEVVETASKLYPTHQLSAFDSHTIQCTVTGEVTYVPIVNGPGQNFAGLFTVDLPNGIRVGNEFNITVRRVTLAQTFLDNSLSGLAAERNKKRLANWRYVAGTFQVKIPVSLEEPLLLPEENLLAILKWRLEQMSPVYRWYPVVQRYISIVSARVKGMGGDPSAVAPSQFGVTKPAGGPPSGRRPHPTGVEFTGKVSAIIYDRFGDFDGFSLLTEEGHEHSFRGREHEVEEIVNRAWIERIVISVFAEHKDHHVPVAIVLRRAPWSHHH